MIINYKFQNDEISDFCSFTKDINISYHCLESSDEEKGDDFLSSINQLLNDFIDFTNPFDHDNLLRIGYLIRNKLQHCDEKSYIEILKFGDFIFLPHLLSLVGNDETYSKNNYLVQTIVDIIREFLKSAEIDVDDLIAPSFFNCILNFAIPNMIQNDSEVSLTSAFNLIKDILRDDEVAVKNFVEKGQFVEVLISYFDTIDENDQACICEVFCQIVKNYILIEEEDNYNRNSFSEVNAKFNSSYLILKNFIEEKMQWFESQPFYVLDLISISIKNQFVDIGKLYIVNSNVIENIIQQFVNDKEELYIRLTSLLNFISSPFSTSLKRNMNENDEEDREEFISTFQWSFFSPLITFILSENIEKNDQFILSYESFIAEMCNTFSIIFKRIDKDIAFKCKDKLNLPSILLNFAASSENSFIVKESSIRALMYLVKIDPCLVFFYQNEVEYENENEQDINLNYLIILIDFLESDCDDNFLELIINSIFYIVIRAEDKAKSKLLYPDEDDENDSYKLVDNFIIETLLNCEDYLQDKIGMAFSNIEISNPDCHELLLRLQNHLDIFDQIINQI